MRDENIRKPNIKLKMVPFVTVMVSWVFPVIDEWINLWSLCDGVWVYEMSDSYYTKRTAGIIDMKPTIRHYNDKTGQISMKSMDNPQVNQPIRSRWLVCRSMRCGCEKIKDEDWKLTLLNVSHWSCLGMLKPCVGMLIPLLSCITLLPSKIQACKEAFSPPTKAILIQRGGHSPADWHH